MSKKRKLVRVIQNFYQQFRRKSPSTVKEQSLWLLRSFIVTKKRPDWVNSGFVLPTVAMVSLVVVLLTVAILFRSFERSKNASNVRVNQAVLNAAMPAIDRARAKIEKLFSDPRLPRSTPNDFSLSQVISDNVNEFTFGDESQLTLFYDINKNNILNTDTANLTDEETIKTAWKYPVDTDNNGKFDSYTLYSIKFRNPPQSGGNPTRVRNPLEARTPPMNETRGSGVCDRGNNTSASLVGSQGWYQRGSTLRRSVFVYTTTVPITSLNGFTEEQRKQYEEFKGNRGFAALEYQQDRERRPLSNNAVLYNDDLEISPGGGINLNGRIVTNSNLFAAERFDDIRFFLVSSPASCYYNERNSKIVVGGNVANARVIDTSNQNSVTVDLFRQNGSPGSDSISGSNRSINLNGGAQIAYNSRAYEKRIQLLVDAGSALSSANLPTEVTEELNKRVAQGKDETIEKAALLRTYFKQRTRRVPYREVPIDDTDTDSVVYRRLAGAFYRTSNVLQGRGDSLRPPDEWVFPYDPADGEEESGYAELPIKKDGRDKMRLPANKTELPEPEGDEAELGDRVVVGNNLPQMWWDESKDRFVSQEEAGQEISGIQWHDVNEPRKRFPQVSELDDLGDTGRDGFWEENAAIYPTDALDVVGGLRVVTGAGIYLPNDYVSNASFSDSEEIVWPDSMPMGVTSEALGLPDADTPYLRMRATAVYHFQDNHYDPDNPSTNPQTPIACVSSYYDPTNEDTAQNQRTYEGRNLFWNTDSDGRSNNGIVYSAPTRTRSNYSNVLNYQAQLRYPNGRLVNKQLKQALDKGSGNLTLAEKSALDSAICAMQIFDGSITPQSSPVIPHGAIRETAFLDARQVKALDKLGTDSETTYDLDVELRQPLEIRATILNMRQLKQKVIGDTTHGTTEYLLPNSGIIYATRDDALPDLSADNNPNDDDDQIGTSSTDFILDRTRRPNAIMLEDGEELNRGITNLNRPEEKGLILASNLPVYIKGDFNRHEEEEFTNTLNIDWSNFYTRTTLNSNFACRRGQFTGCNRGEKWRSATVLADAITVLSGNFEEGYRNEGDYNLRDNWGYARLGYDVDGNGRIDGSVVTLDETILQLDLDGDGDIDNTSVDTWEENLLGININGDDDRTDSFRIRENNIPSVVARRLNGFWDNNFVTSFAWREDDEENPGFPEDLAGNEIKSSYFNNFVTPIQRRGEFAEYVMEICRKPTVADCEPDDWVVGYQTGSTIDWNYRAIDSGASRIEPNNPSFTARRLGAGTTARPAIDEDDRIYPRRVAFLRNAAGELILDTNDRPIPLGITGSDSPTPNSSIDNNGQINYYPYEDKDIDGTEYDAYERRNRPRLHLRALWFKTIEDTEDSSANYGYNYPLWIETLDGLNSTDDPKEIKQPLLIPVLQIQFPFIATRNDYDGIRRLENASGEDVNNDDNNWVQIAENTETNLIFAQGDTPARPNESNGGLENFVRYLEKWGDAAHRASGSFIQFKRSSYATAPWSPIVANYTSDTRAYSTNGTIFGFPQMYRIRVNNRDQNNTSRGSRGKTPFYVQPGTRAWGFDVALLTQLPDLFSQRFTAPPTGDPNEFYREVSRDDTWVSTLLCAAQATANPGNYGAARTHGSGKEYAIPADMRPSQCQ